MSIENVDAIEAIAIAVIDSAIDVGSDEIEKKKNNKENEEAIAAVDSAIDAGAEDETEKYKTLYWSNAILCANTPPVEVPSKFCPPLKRKFRVGAKDISIKHPKYSRVWNSLCLLLYDMKVNVDGSMSTFKPRATIGGVLRGLNGSWIGVFDMVVGLSDIFKIEARVLLEGLKFVWAKGYRKWRLRVIIRY
ncbi:hypothetical protein PVK06_015182 [Gossypium arboreum]|uniref:RNase H type-1 domain-containing protein n=1 Tax=Gossypium arboreum TaxID=29729 RepID=A0ABR0PWH6_GOSAR|nr:hypothetical protein PVK06_015182 [Gossypium arboreum]